MTSIEPTQEQFAQLAGATDDGPVVMLNLLRFKERADGIDAADGISGAEAYARYGAAAHEYVQRGGGRIVIAASVEQMVIGPGDERWDMMIIVEYPSRRAFLEMTSDPGYLESHGHRAAALSDSRLIACRVVEI